MRTQLGQFPFLQRPASIPCMDELFLSVPHVSNTCYSAITTQCTMSAILATLQLPLSTPRQQYLLHCSYPLVHHVSNSCYIAITIQCTMSATCYSAATIQYTMSATLATLQLLLSTPCQQYLLDFSYQSVHHVSITSYITITT